MASESITARRRRSPPIRRIAVRSSARVGPARPRRGAMPHPARLLARPSRREARSPRVRATPYTHPDSDRGEIAHALARIGESLKKSRILSPRSGGGGAASTENKLFTSSNHMHTLLRLCSFLVGLRRRYTVAFELITVRPRKFFVCFKSVTVARIFPRHTGIAGHSFHVTHPLGRLRSFHDSDISPSPASGGFRVDGSDAAAGPGPGRDTAQ